MSNKTNSQEPSSSAPTPSSGTGVWFELRAFRTLRADELYALLQLRSAVFVVEQTCPFQDMDDKDQYALHLLGWKDSTLVACSRLLPPGISYDEASIGRVATAMSVRGTGVGRELMRMSVAAIRKHYNSSRIKIGAQLYLKSFYESLGFAQCGPEYPEDDIPHIPMMLEAE